jgi:sigma-B regulation protein RsbU (phosphoserine phosphatase)
MTLAIVIGVVASVFLGMAAAAMLRKARAADQERRWLNQRLAMDAALAGFSEHAIEAATVEQVTDGVVGPLAAGVDVRRVVLLRRVAGEWTAQEAPGGGMGDPPPQQAQTVFTWLARNPEPVFAQDLADRRYGAMRLPISELMGRYATDVLLPLGHRGELVAVLGLGVRGPGTPYRPEEREFVSHLHLEAAAAAANATLLREVALRATLERELDLAQAIQRELVPERAEAHVGPIGVAGYYGAGSIEGGSHFWNHYALPDGRVLVLVGDVAGDGLAASMLLAVALGAWDTVREQGNGDPGELLAVMNRALYRPSLRTWITCGAAVVDPKHASVVYANAGHTLPYHVAANAGKPQIGCLVVQGPAVGDRLDSRFPTVSKPFRRGDTLLFYTRGVVERRDGDGRAFGDRRLQRALRNVAAQELDAGKVRDKLLDELATWSGGSRGSEDEVLLVVRSL